MEEEAPAAARIVAAGEHKVNAAAPRIVAEGIRLERAQAVAGQELILVYSLVSLRVAEIEAEHWVERIKPMIVLNVRRAQEEEAYGLFEAEITVKYRYVDGAGQLIVQIDVASRPFACDPGESSSN